MESNVHNLTSFNNISDTNIAKNRESVSSVLGKKKIKMTNAYVKFKAIDVSISFDFVIRSLFF